MKIFLTLIFVSISSTCFAVGVGEQYTSPAVPGCTLKVLEVVNGMARVAVYSKGVRLSPGDITVPCYRLREADSTPVSDEGSTLLVLNSTEQIDALRKSLGEVFFSPETSKIQRDKIQEFVKLLAINNFVD